MRERVDRGGIADVRRMRVGIALALPLAFAATAGAQPSPETFPGSSEENAIVLPGIADEFHGAIAEQTYIADHFPTWHIEYLATVEHDDRHYDLLGMILPDRTKATIFFDATAWFGR